MIMVQNYRMVFIIHIQYYHIMSTTQSVLFFFCTVS